MREVAVHISGYHLVKSAIKTAVLLLINLDKGSMFVTERGMVCSAHVDGSPAVTGYEVVIIFICCPLKNKSQRVKGALVVVSLHERDTKVVEVCLSKEG